MRLLRNILIILAIVLLEIACMGKLYMLYSYWIGCHLQWIHTSVANDRIVAAAGLAVVIWMFLEKKLQTWQSFFEFSRFLWPLLIFLLYGYACCNDRQEFTLFHCCSNFAYADVAAVVFGLWWLMPLLKDGTCSLKKWICKEDVPDDKDKDCPLFETDETRPKDELGRKEEADSICGFMLSEKNKYNSTLAVAVRGSWGTGKTTLINYMKDSLNAKKITFFDYSPWLCSDGEVSLHFLWHLDAHLHQQGVGVNGLQMYIRSLSVSNITGWFPLMVHALRHLFTAGKDTIQGSLESVSEAMGMLEKPVVAFIDDVDRVGKEDFLSVMKLVRMTARFPNLIYVVAYDDTVAKELLKDYGQGDKFLDKIFNVKHDLQSVTEEKMQELANGKLKAFEEYDESEDVFSSLTLTDYITTIRELKHFFNLMRKDYLGMSRIRQRCYFNFPFFVKFELLKYYDLYVWQRIKENPSSYLKTKNEWDDMMAYVVKAEMKQIGNQHTKELLAILFDSEIAADCEYVCPGGLQMMYPDMYDNSYLSKQETDDAIKKNRLYSEIYGWIEAKRQGIAFMLSHHLGDISVTDMAKVCCEMIKFRPNDIIQSPLDLLLREDGVTTATFRQIRKQNNPYNYVENHHELYLFLLHQIRSAEDDAGIKELKEYAKNTPCPRELMAIVYGMMMEGVAHDMVPDRWVYNLAGILFQKLADLEPKDGIENQYHVIEALEYLPYYQSQYQLLKPLLEKDLGSWLRWTIRQDDTLGNDVILTADINVMRTMFDTYEEYKGMTVELMSHNKDDDEKKAIIEEHRKLVEQTSLISALPISSFYQSQYPHLKSIIYQDQVQLPMLHQNYEKTKEELSNQEHPFFKNESRLPELFG